MANRRQKIVNAIVDLIKTNINGVSPFTANIYENVWNKQIFLDELNDYPTVSVFAAGESREYLPAGFKWGFLSIEIRIYVQDEFADDRLEELFDDIEIVLDQNNTLVVDNEPLCTDIRILSLTDDEGLLNPLGIGEMSLQVQYPV
jgi:hypothetical protein